MPVCKGWPQYKGPLIHHSCSNIISKTISSIQDQHRSTVIITNPSVKIILTIMRVTAVSILFAFGLIGHALASPIVVPTVTADSNTTLIERQVADSCGAPFLTYKLAGKDGKGDKKTIYYDKQVSVCQPPPEHQARALIPVVRTL